MRKFLNRFLIILSVVSMMIATFVAAKLVLPQLQETNVLPQLMTKTEQIIEEEKKSPEVENDTADVKQTPAKKVSRLSYDEHLKKGDMFAENGFYALAIQEYLKASEIEPKSLDPFIKMGNLQKGKNNYEEAEKSFKKALEKSPHNNQTIISIVKTDIQTKKFKEAQEILGEVTAPDQETVYYQALLEGYFGKYDSSKQLLTNAIQQNPQSSSGKNSEIVLQTFIEFEKFQGGSPHHQKTLLARSFNQVGEYTLASELLYQVLRDLPQYRDAWILLGYSFLKQQNYIDAKHSLEQALQLDPEKAETQYFLGLAFAGLNDFEKAILHLEIALHNQFKPQIQVKQKLAELYLLNKNYENAVKFYEEIIQNEDATAEHFIRPIWLYIDYLKQPQKAISLAEKLNQKFPQDALSLNLQGWAKLASDRLEEARKDFEAALKLDPTLDAVHLNLGMLFEKQGDLEKAKRFYKKAYNLGQGNSIANAAAERYNKLVEDKNN